MATPTSDPAPGTGEPGVPPLSVADYQRLERDFACYRRELARLLEEGHANRHVLIKDGQVLSIWDTVGDALQAGHDRFGLEPFAVNKINPLDVERFALLDAGKVRDLRGGPACPP